MKYMSVLLLFLFSGFCFTRAQQSDSLADKLVGRNLTQKEMKEDFAFLRDILEKTHPGLYRYTAREVMQKKFDSLSSLLQPMAFYDYYALLSRVISQIRCAHTYIVPEKDLGKYMSVIKAIPYEIIPVGDRLYVTLNGTMDTIVRPGYEIISIDGRSINEIMKQLYSQTWADGYIQSSKTKMIGGSQFGLFYYMMIDRPDTFSIAFKDLQGKQVQLHVPAISPQVYRQHYFTNPVNKDLLALYVGKNKKDQENGWRLEVLDEPSTALLRINGFGGGNNGEEAAKKMRDFMDKNMDTLKAKKIKNLIVDVRDNGGGWDVQGVELFTYLMKDTTPVRYYARQHAITNNSDYLKYSDLSEEDKAKAKKELKPEPDGTFSLREEFNEDLQLKSPKANRFTGNVYFLVNGASGSTTSEFAAVAHSNRIGVFIGDETGGAYEGGNGGSFLHFQLPNSGIALGTPLVYYNNAVQTPKQKGRGVIPDHPVLLTIENILQGRDVVMEKVLSIIRAKQ